MDKTCWIFRGPPGSGKTTAAKKLFDLLRTAGPTEGGFVYLSMDDYCTDEEGNYKFDPSKIGENVKRLKDEFDAAVFGLKHTNIIVDNTHSRYWEYGWAIDKAEAAGYQVHVLEVQADMFVCAKRQKHPVPLEKLVEMFSRWESPLKIPDVQDLALRMLKALL
jgi:tRNA uridine 5-carbamoylmethylation protein Kti12